MAFGFQPRKGVGVFGPRVAIYTIAILAMAWLMWRYDRNVQEERASREALRSNTPEVIESTLVGNEPMLLLLLEDNEATSEIAADIRERLSGKCRFAHLYVAGEWTSTASRGHSGWTICRRQSSSMQTTGSLDGSRGKSPSKRSRDSSTCPQKIPQTI